MSNGIADQKADTNRDAESECPEVVSLRNQLSSREKELAGAVKIIQEIYASPGWKLIQRYRGWTQSQRLLRPRLFRRYEKAALWLLSKLEANPSIANGSRVAVAEEPVSGGGVLIQSRTGGYKQRVYYAKDGKRHWVPDPLWATQNGFRFPDDVQLVSDEHIAGLRQSSVAPHKWTAANWRNPTGAGASIREIATSRLSGCGIEFGAGESPMPIPLHCDVRYADRLPADKFASQYHPGEIIDAVIPDLVTGIDQMEGVPEKSLDFVVACHVIEHTPIPLLTFETVYSRLKEGGQFVLVVPDKQFTFDKDRELTPLEHFILDYRSRSRDRDWEHYVEWHTKAFPCPPETRDAFVRNAFEAGIDIHYHTWTFESFAEMVEYSRGRISPWSEVWSHPTPREFEEAIEFYFVLTK